jgi:NifU-like protein
MSVAEEKYSKKFDEASSQPKCRGAYYQEDAVEKGMALVEAKFKDTKLYWLVDTNEDRIYSAKFFAYGGKVSIAVGDTLCQMVKGLTIQEACSLLGVDVESNLRDDADVPSVPESKMQAFNNVDELLKIVRDDYTGAKALALARSQVKADEKPKSLKELSMAEQAWLALSKEDQKTQVNLVLDEHIRPALINDGGNVEILDITDGEKILIQYQGACGSCGSSLGATLSFIEQTLRKHIYNELVVVPNM